MASDAARLPGRPHAIDDRQQALTAELLVPALPAVTDWLQGLRRSLDPALKAQFPEFAGKPYPLGRCKEIRNTAAAHLRTALQTPPAPGDHPGLQTLRQFLSHEGRISLIWGDLRGQYFQNAMQFGSLYVDVANDTVVATKPQVEILPMAESGYSPITDYEHFCRIARVYWQAECYANTVFPALAPYLPLVCVNGAGAAWLAAAFDEMIEATRASGFRLSEQILASLPAPDAEAATKLRQQHPAQGNPFLDEVGCPLACCRQYREQGLHETVEHRAKAVLAYLGRDS
jgi:hypothetical protein